MQIYLLIFEGIGTPELLLILVVALIIFGPKKLPQLARSFGKSMSEFKRASEDFKQQWEKEVESIESATESIKSDLSLVEAEDAYNAKTISRRDSFGALTGGSDEPQTETDFSHETSKPITTEIITAPEIKEVEQVAIPATENETSQPQKTSKRDWL